MKRLYGKLIPTSALFTAALLLTATHASATLLTIDGLIFQNVAGADPTKMSGTLDYTVTGANQVTIVMTNTSLDSAFTNSSFPAAMLMTGFGLQLGSNITSGTVTANGVMLNFDAGQTANISNQYIYANGVIDGYGQPGVLAVNNIVSSVANGGGTRFAAGTPPSIGGPDYGSLSALETQFGSSQSGVQSSITFVLNLDGAAPSFNTVNGGNVVIAFGSPESGGTSVPDGGTSALLLGSAMLLLPILRRRIA